MSVGQKQINDLKEQISSGFLVSQYTVSDGMHRFILPALEYDKYEIAVPDGPAIREFVNSEEFKKAQMKPHKFGVALLDIVGFSKNPDDIQLKMIVRYQCLVRGVLKDTPVKRIISIGDGSIFVFAEADIPNMPKYLYSVDHALAGFNLDFGADNMPKIEWRIGVHVGRAYVFRDINGQTNYIGTAVNLAQRVSTCVPDSWNNNMDFRAKSTIYVSEEAYNEFVSNGLNEEFDFLDTG
ncbi:unnamed protein product, partial [marine sediment metagenome]